MSASRDLLRSFQLADSAFPSGAFAFSNGLEALVSDGRANGPDEVESLLRDQIAPRWLDIDRYFVAQAFAAGGDDEAIGALDAECHVTTSTPALRDASQAIGRSLLMSHFRIGSKEAAAFRVRLKVGSAKGHAAVVQGVVGFGAGLPLSLVEVGALHGQLSGYLSAAVRLGKIGALDAQAILARTIDHVGKRLDLSPPNMPAGFSPLVEIAAARPNGPQARLFAN
ncbi:MAG: urease accessory protein [Litorivivens sp.]